MRIGNYLAASIIILGLCTSVNGQTGRERITFRHGTNGVENLVSSEKALNHRITALQIELKQLKEKQARLRDRIHDQIRDEIKRTGEMKEKILAENNQTKIDKENKIKRSIERNEDRIKALKKLDEELKNNWKDN